MKGFPLGFVLRVVSFWNSEKAYDKWTQTRKKKLLLRAFVTLFSLLPFSEDTKEKKGRHVVPWCSHMRIYFKRGPQIVPHVDNEVINHK